MKVATLAYIERVLQEKVTETERLMNEAKKQKDEHIDEMAITGYDITEVYRAARLDWLKANEALADFERHEW